MCPIVFRLLTWLTLYTIVCMRIFWTVLLMCNINWLTVFVRVPMHVQLRNFQKLLWSCMNSYCVVWLTLSIQISILYYSFMLCEWLYTIRSPYYITVIYHVILCIQPKDIVLGTTGMCHKYNSLTNHTSKLCYCYVTYNILINAQYTWK